MNKTKTDRVEVLGLAAGVRTTADVPPGRLMWRFYDSPLEAMEAAADWQQILTCIRIRR